MVFSEASVKIYTLWLFSLLSDLMALLNAELHYCEPLVASKQTT